MYSLKCNRYAEYDFSSFNIHKYQEYSAKARSDIIVFKWSIKSFFKGYLFLKVYVHGNVKPTQVTQVR